MVKVLVKKFLTRAIQNFAKDENIEPTRIQIMIRSAKGQEENIPEYFYMVDYAPKMNEEDSDYKILDFTSDILRKKYDPMNREILAAQFLTGYFTAASKAHEINSKELFIMIASEDEKVKELNLGLYHNSEEIKSLTLETLFGEDD